MATTRWVRACALALAPGLLFLLPRLARAQTPVATPARSRLSLEIGADHASVLDPLASPLRYAGAGAGLGLAYTRETAGSMLELRAALAGDRLGSALSGTAGGPREYAGFATLGARWLRRVAGSGGAVSDVPGLALLVGGDARLDISARDHLYSQPASSFAYGLALASLGPAAGLRLTRANGGEMSAEVAAPLVGLALRPYGDLEYLREGFHPVLAAPPSLMGLEGNVSWKIPLRRSGARLVLDWRIAYLRYGRSDVYYSARQRLATGIELPLGGKR